MENKNKTSKSLIIVITAIIALFFAILYIIAQKKESYSSEERAHDSGKAIVCVDNKRDDAFFYSSRTIAEEHEIKVIIYDNGPKDIFYSFTGEYDSHEDVVKDENTLHARYNEFMGENNMSLEFLSPSYSILEKKFILNLFNEDYNNLGNLTSSFFFINKDDLSSFSKYSVEQAKSYYEKKGFTCKTGD